MCIIWATNFILKSPENTHQLMVLQNTDVECDGALCCEGQNALPTRKTTNCWKWPIQISPQMKIRIPPWSIFWVWQLICVIELLDWHYLTRVWQRRHWRDLENGELKNNEVIIEFDYMKKIDLEKFVYHKSTTAPSCVPIFNKSKFCNPKQDRVLISNIKTCSGSHTVSFGST